MRLIALLAVLVSLAGCGRNYEPPALKTTGIPPTQLGQVIDVEAELPHLKLPGATLSGVRLELRFEIDGTGPGLHPARVVYGQARYDWSQTLVDVEDLSNGETTVLVTDDDWTPGRLGPLRIENTVFEVILDGVPKRGGRYITGISWESLSGLTGAFEGWRRHRFLVAGTDFLSGVGRVSRVDLIKENEIEVHGQLELVSSDPVLRVSGPAAFAINRLTFDNLQRLDPGSAFATAWQASVGAGSNPHDVAVVSEDKAYVTRYEPPFNDVAVFDPAGGPVTASIALESLAENPDATPRPDRMRLAGGSLFVALQDIDRTFTQFGEGKLAVIDPTLDEVVGSIPLGGKNPGELELLPGADGRLRLYVAMSGIYEGLQAQELSGGVAVVDVEARILEGYALDDDDAGDQTGGGANVGALAMVSEQLGYVGTSDASFVNRVQAFDPETGTVRRDVLESFDLIPEIELDGDGVLAIPDRSFFQPRLCLYRVPQDPALVEQLIGCANLDVPPFSLEALD